MFQAASRVLEWAAHFSHNARHCSEAFDADLYLDGNVGYTEDVSAARSEGVDDTKANSFGDNRTIDEKGAGQKGESQHKPSKNFHEASRIQGVVTNCKM